jgi:glycine betaine/proline transport system permease protein
MAQATTAGPVPAAAARWLRPPVLLGGAALIALAVAVVASGFAADFPAAWRVPLIDRVDDLADWVIRNRRDHWIFVGVFQPITTLVRTALNETNAWLDLLGWAGVLLVTAAIAYVAAGWRVVLVALGSLAGIGLIGVWDPAMRTLSLMTVAVLISLAVGIPLGILAGRRPAVAATLRPVLDVFQTTPAYVYLLPLALFFAIGDPAAVVATIIYALPPAVRLTALGIQSVPSERLEVGHSLGTTGWQQLRTIQLPAAMPSIRVGINQTIMMALAMVVIGSLIGGTGLGQGVLRGLQQVNVGRALEPGVAIVLIAVLLDRVTYSAGARGHQAPRGWRTPALVGGAFVLSVAAGMAGLLRGDFPGEGLLSFAAGANALLRTVQDAILPATRAFSDILIVYGLEPLRQGLLLLPWWLLVGVVAVVAWRLVGPGLSAYVVGAFVVIGATGMWGNTMNTTSQVAVATALAVALGVPLGILAGLSDPVEKGLRPVLDTLQTLPAFVYLIPVVALFQIGRVPGVIATVVYALPPAVRLTSAGIRGAPAETVEAARSTGATTPQLLRTVLLPQAKPQIMLGVNQTTMMALASIVIAGLIGAGGLGFQAVLGLTRSEYGIGIVAGLAIVLLGIVLDRLTQALGTTDEATRATVKTG